MTHILNSEIVPVNSLDVFDKGKLTCSIIDTYEFSLAPSFPFKNGSQLVFDIPASPNSFLSPNFYIDVVLKGKTITKKTDGTEEKKEIAASDKLTLESIPFHTLWSSLQISMNDVVINNKNDKYPYLAYLDRVHLTDAETHNIHKDLELGALNEGNTTSLYTGAQQDIRRNLISGDQELFLRGKLVHPMLQQNRYILPSTSMTITLHQTSDNFRFVTDPTAIAKAELEIDRVHLIGHRLIPNAQLLLDTMSALGKMPAQYPIIRFEPQVFDIPVGVQTVEKLLTLSTGKVPRMVFFSTFEGAQGSIGKSAYRAKCSNIKSAYIQIEDQKYPTRPYDATTREGQIKIFSDYKHNTSQLMGGKTNMMDATRFMKDFTMVSISLDRFHGTERNKQDTATDAVTLPRTGSCTLHINTSSPTVESQTVIVILVYDSTITFNQALIPHCDF